MWVIPVGPSIPPYYTDFNDPWALKFYLNPTSDQVGGSPLHDLSLDLRSLLRRTGSVDERPSAARGARRSRGRKHLGVRVDLPERREHPVSRRPIRLLFR
ncbi:MAG: hypothetical protein MZU97_14395 [Bacillus subtilis]|nr:hypothetical protein [Bacillus subtilis]